MDTLQCTTTTDRPVNPRWRILIAVAAVLLLSMPSAVGVYKALEPTRGPVAAGAAALGFELCYLSISLLVLRPDLRRQARAVALGAVFTAILLNTLADYTARVPGGLAGAAEAARLFDPLALALALVESLPLAALSYALAQLLHRLAEAPEAPAPVVAERVEDTPSYPPPALVMARDGEAAQAFAKACAAPATRAYHCPHCSATLPNAGALGSAVRRGYCRLCKPNSTDRA